MPKQPDLIAAEMQGDATISKGVEEAAAKLYARRHEPAVQRALRAAIAAEAPPTQPDIPPAEKSRRRWWPL